MLSFKDEIQDPLSPPPPPPNPPLSSVLYGDTYNLPLIQNAQAVISRSHPAELWNKMLQFSVAILQ